ncbi:MAG: nicotinate (nicotinamide) nucleotide adenylyltransferase [Planctomycetota bacterium]
MNADTPTAPNPIPQGPITALLYGGSFDPPHAAHLTLPLRVRDAIGAGLVVYIPAACSPFKEHAPTASNDQRVAMLRAGLAGEDRVAIATLEFEREGPSYTVDTLRRLREERPDAALRLLVGADQARSFHKWRDAHTIVQLAPPVVMLRPGEGDGAELLDELRTHWDDDATARWSDGLAPIDEVVDASSTGVRTLLAQHRDSPRLDDLLAPAVRGFIEREGLYSA